jgi:hypothetical protein
MDNRCSNKLMQFGCDCSSISNPEEIFIFSLHFIFSQKVAKSKSRVWFLPIFLRECFKFFSKFIFLRKH